jgi:DNA-binding IclR family transcriptional regulator
MNKPKQNPYYKINSCEKTMNILSLLAEKKTLSVAELARYLNLNRSTCHRFVATLRDLGFITQHSPSSYSLTLKIFELGMQVAESIEIRPIARPYLNELSLQFRETVNLGYWDQGVIVHIDKVDGLETLRTDYKLGARAPAYCTALGKSILAFLPRYDF